jgi:asparagine synthase (glutamine-hydrolysing)
MCGIFACVDPGDFNQERVANAVSSMRHRGPDTTNIWYGDHVALGHTRLAIIDLETGDQPLTNEDQTLHIIVNGEFYDHDRIRESLIPRGHTFGSQSDSEIALHLYEEHGTDCLKHLRGEFAFALFDRNRNTLFAARDRFGIKPLFYTCKNGQLMIASEVKALFEAGHPAHWSDTGMFQVLHFAQTASGSLFEGVHQLPPGHFMEFKNGSLRIQRYWDTHYPRRNTPYTRNPEEEYAAIQSELETALRLRTRADVPLGCYLSGGVDSSMALGLARRITGDNIQAFCIAFDHADYDESDAAAEMAAYAEVDFHRIPASGSDLAAVFEASVTQGEMLQYNGHAPARYLLSQAVQQTGIKCVLGGEGADELFGGYTFARKAIEGSSGSGIGKLMHFLQSPRAHPLAGLSPTLARVLQATGMDEGLVALAAQRLKQYQSLLHPDFLTRHQATDPFKVFLKQFKLRELAGREPYKIITPLWMKSHFVNYVLAGERLDMGHAVEVRLPFLDHHLFELMRDIPSAHLARRGENKHLLRQIAKGVVCPRVLQSAKKPFFAPPGSGDDVLHQLFQDLLRSQTFEAIPFFNHNAVRLFLDGVYRLDESERFIADPLLYLLASATVLQKNYQLEWSI